MHFNPVKGSSILQAILKPVFCRPFRLNVPRIGSESGTYAELHNAIQSGGGSASTPEEEVHSSASEELPAEVRG